jgi:catechol 2,3-dioxygenase-like lactoylglutathione lyase family enzyme
MGASGQESGESVVISRVTVITLGVNSLEKSTAFYRSVFGISPNGDYEGVAFFELPGTWVTLYPRAKLAEEISPALSPAPGGFSGVTLAYNARDREEVLALFDLARDAGATIVKPPHETFWGGFSGYFADPDSYFWEIAWGPMFDFAPDGGLRFKKV